MTVTDADKRLAEADPLAFSRAVLADIEFARSHQPGATPLHYELIEVALRAMLSTHADSTAPDPDLPLPCSKECDWCGENMPAPESTERAGESANG